MRSWVKPRTEVQKFEANEYVAACWKIACTVGAAGEVNEAHPDPHRPAPGVTHSHNSDGNGCGWEDSQYIVEVGDGVFNVTEYGQNILPCKLTRNNDWTGLQKSISDVQPGQTIYWTTSLGDRTWYHYGTVGLEDANHPNRS